jgi:formate dehydrogenase major subunit
MPEPPVAAPPPDPPTATGRPPPRAATVRLTIDGVEHEVEAGRTVLEVCERAGIALPTLCHDGRLADVAVCRLCVVEIEGEPWPHPACTTPARDAMVVRTSSEALERRRAATLALLADRLTGPGACTKPFDALTARYGVSARAGRGPLLVDDSHPYIQVDMSRCINCLRCVRICADVQGQSVWGLRGRGDAVSIEVDRGASLAESSCVACGACVSSCPTGALEDKSVLARGAPTAWTRTTCPYCGVGCEMRVGTRGGAIVQVMPADDAPVNRGHLCVKGRYAFDFVDAPDRVTTPLLREGGALREASWGEALGWAARRLGALLERHGPGAVGVLGSARATNEENYVAQKFARLVLGTNNVDCCARVCHAPSAYGLASTLGTGAATGSFDDIELASTILVFGANVTESHPVVGARIRQRARRGARLVVVDPRRTEIALEADVHLAPRPGTNVPLLHALAHVVVAEGLVDEPFVAGRVEGWPEYRDFVAAWTPERAAAVCGVDPEAVREAARLYARNRPSLCMHGLGVTEHVQGADAVTGLVNLALLTGNVGVPGAGLNPLRGQNNVQGSAHMGCEPSRLTGYAPIDKARALFERVWGAALPTGPGLNLLGMMDEAARGSLRGLWAVGYDVGLTNPNANATRRSLASLELLIVQDLFLNETARDHAHLFLPAASSFEKDGTFMNAERRVQRVRAAIAPRGGAKNDFWPFCEVARLLGKGEGFAFDSAEQVWEEVRRVWPAGAGITYERLERGGLQWPCPDVAHPGTVRLHGDRFGDRERAPLRRFDYVPSREQPSEAYPFVLNTGRGLYQFNAGTMTRRTPNARLAPSDALEMAPADAARLGLADGERVRVRSAHGETSLVLRVSPRVRQGELFATFQDPATYLNRVTGVGRDAHVGTPEYKVTAVWVERA